MSTARDTFEIADYALIVDREAVMTQWHRMASSGHPLSLTRSTAFAILATPWRQGQCPASRAARGGPSG
jgi:hypothetical protein